jgi:hypothetical protein
LSLRRSALCRRFHKGIIGRCSNGALPPFSLTKPSNASAERRCYISSSAAVFIKALLVAVATALCRRFYNKAVQRIGRATLLHFQLCRGFHKGINGRCSNGALSPFS